MNRFLACLAICSTLLSLPSLAIADSWLFPAALRQQVYNHGDVRIVLNMDSRQNQRSPEFRVDVFKSEKQVAMLPGIAFEELHASSDNSLFLGLSNSGLFRSAIVLFNSRGEVLMLANHGDAVFDYCTQTTSIVRIWYNQVAPSVRFSFGQPGQENGVFIRTCNGKDIELRQVLREAFARALTR